MSLSVARRLSPALLAIVLGLLLVIETVDAQQGQPVSPLTEQHELLKKDVGIWDTSGKIWPGPGAEPIVSRGR
jgi:hypothetical protein